MPGASGKNGGAAPQIFWNFMKNLKNLLTSPLTCDILIKSHLSGTFVLGEVSEWFKELVLKTSDAKAPRVRISASPPLIQFHISYSEKYSSWPKRRPC